ncbi:MAG: hypothetical protein EOO41_01390 [Methanobacteriota archaeon]|nr:MAG: hypothetical protein EOO41_01390 [Euryarchaeota archaeon]
MQRVSTPSCERRAADALSPPAAAAAARRRDVEASPATDDVDPRPCTPSMPAASDSTACTLPTSPISLVRLHL